MRCAQVLDFDCFSQELYVSVAHFTSGHNPLSPTPCAGRDSTWRTHPSAAMAATAILGDADFPARGDCTVPYRAFRRRRDVLGVVVPERMKSIGRQAFYGCSGLVDVTFPATLQSINKGAFLGCTGLLELEFPTTAHTIGGSGEGPYGNYGAFQGCTNLRTLILPPALTSLGAAAFKGSTANLLMLVIPPTASAEVATAMVAMLGPRKGKAPGATNYYDPDVDFPAVSTVQLVSAPDAVVAPIPAK